MLTVLLCVCAASSAKLFRAIFEAPVTRTLSTSYERQYGDDDVDVATAKKIAIYMDLTRKRLDAKESKENVRLLFSTSGVCQNSRRPMSEGERHVRAGKNHQQRYGYQ